MNSSTVNLCSRATYPIYRKILVATSPDNRPKAYYTLSFSCLIASPSISSFVRKSPLNCGKKLSSLLSNFSGYGRHGFGLRTASAKGCVVVIIGGGGVLNRSIRKFSVESIRSSSRAIKAA